MENQYPVVPHITDPDLSLPATCKKGGMKKGKIMIIVAILVIVIIMVIIYIFIGKKDKDKKKKSTNPEELDKDISEEVNLDELAK